MSTHATTPGSPIYPRPSGPRMTDDQLQMLKTQLVALRRLSDATGFSTNKQIIDMLSKVSQADLILLGLLFEPVDDSR